MSRNTITVGRRGYWTGAIAHILALTTLGAHSATAPEQRPSNAPHRKQNPPAFQGKREKARRQRQEARDVANRARRAGAQLTAGAATSATPPNPTPRLVGA
jgi:hypothetical protein